MSICYNHLELLIELHSSRLSRAGDFPARETLDGQHDKKAGRLKQNLFCFPRPTAGEVNRGPATLAGQFGETKVLNLNLKTNKKKTTK